MVHVNSHFGQRSYPSEMEVVLESPCIHRMSRRALRHLDEQGGLRKDQEYRRGRNGKYRK